MKPKRSSRGFGVNLLVLVRRGGRRQKAATNLKQRLQNPKVVAGAL